MNQQWKVICRVVAISMTALMLASCGGGSGDAVGKCYSPSGAVCAAVGVPRSFPEPVTSPVGLYKGVTSNGRSLGALVFDDNSFYAIYSQVNNPSVAAGAVQGTVRIDQGSFSITDALDVNLEGLGTRVAAVTGSYEQKKVLAGTIAYAGTPSVGFTANYSPDFELSPSISAVAGRYVSTSTNAGRLETTTMDIGNAGDITGTVTGGCVFSGTIKPRASGNAYLVSVSFAAAPCRFPGTTVNGVSYFDRTSNTAYTIAWLPGQSASFIMIAAKQ